MGHLEGLQAFGAQLDVTTLGRRINTGAVTAGAFSKLSGNPSAHVSFEAG